MIMGDDHEQAFSVEDGTEDHLDWSFSSSSCTGRSSSGRTSSLALSLSFNDRDRVRVRVRVLPHRASDPHWSAIRAASNLSSSGSLQLRHLKLVRQLGSGNLGRVFLCRLRDCDDHEFALKVVDNDTLSHKKACQAKTESDILASLDHPFLPTLYARIDAPNLRYTCLLIDYCPGGDLHSLMAKRPRPMSMPAVRFVAAEVLVALQYLHSLGIVYRDLKPENILLRADGHIMLSDFDLCFTTMHDVRPRVVRLPKGKRTTVEEVVAEPTGAWSRSCVGTHEYLAPELVAGTGHGTAVDWWAFGVLLYELMYGTTPFKGPTKEATLRNIASCDSIPNRGSRDSAADHLISRLLVKDPTTRLGSKLGAAHIKHHPFFKTINWPLIRNTNPPKDLFRNSKPKPEPKPKPRCWPFST